MDKITNAEQVRNMSHSAMAMSQLDIADITDENFWKVRELARFLSDQCKPVFLAGDEKIRFLHVSIDDPDKVAYTKDADKGRQDIQTRTTLEAYKAKFGLSDDAQEEISEGRVSSDAQDEFMIRELITEYFDCLDRMEELKSQLRGLI